jgi:hypothetical protein
MVDWGLEEDGRSNIWVVGRKSKAKLEVQARVGCLGWSGDGGSPGEHIAVVGKGGDARCRGKHHSHKLRLESETGQYAGSLSEPWSQYPSWLLSLPLRDTLRVSFLWAGVQLASLVHGGFARR